MRMTYRLEIYKPGNDEEIAQSFISAQPFAPLKKGESIMLAGIKEKLYITELGHIINEVNTNITHTICVQTEDRSFFPKDYTGIV